MKKFLSTVLAMSLMLSLAACSGSSDNSSTADNSGSSEDLYSIAMVTDVGGVNDQSFNQSAWEGVQAAVKELGGVSKYVETTDTKDYGNNIKLAPGKYDVEVTVGSPADDFMLHTGKDSSGVQGRFWSEPLKFEFKNWQWDGQLI